MKRDLNLSILYNKSKMFSNVKRTHMSFNIDNAKKDISKIMNFITKHEQTIRIKLEDKGYFHSDEIEECSSSLVFSLIIPCFSEHWKYVSGQISELTGLYVSGKPYYNYDLDKLGENGILEMYFKL